MKEILLSISGLSKHYYGKRHGLHKALRMKSAIEKDKTLAIKAVDDVSLDIYTGEIFGILGSNGAGKSTLLKMLCGLTEADSGKIMLLGKEMNIYSSTIKQDIGALIEAPVFFKKMSARRNLQYLGTLNGNVTDARITEMAQLFDINDRLDYNMDGYSMGMYQKIGIIQAIMHKPKLLILDEPTNGLDPKWIIEVRNVLKRLARDYGMTVIISSHILAEMQELCDRIAIIDNGKIVKIGSMEELLGGSNASSYDDIEYNVSDANLAIAVANRYNCRVLAKGNLVLVRIDKSRVTQFNRDLIMSGVDIRGINVRKQRLEDVFRQATSRDRQTGTSESYPMTTATYGNDSGSGLSLDSLIEKGVVPGNSTDIYKSSAVEESVMPIITDDGQADDNHSKEVGNE